MSGTGSMLQKKSGRSYSGSMAIAAILLIGIIFASGCTRNSGSDDYYDQGVYYNNHDNQYDKALENLNRSVGLEPGNPKVWFARSVTLYNLKRYNESLESLNTTLAIDPDYGAALYLKGDVLRIIGRVNESEKYLAKAKNFGYASETYKSIII
jgi:tetratricopeptide (TPR) repeat protein